MALRARDEHYQPPIESLGRSTQEIHAQAVELDAAMRRDRAGLQRQAIVGHRMNRVLASVLLGVLAAVPGGSLSVMSAVVATVVLYVGAALAVTSAVARSQTDDGHDIATIALLALDVAMVSVLCSIGRATVGVAGVLVIGAFLVPAATFSFGRRFGVVAALLTGIGYLAAAGFTLLAGTGPRLDLVTVGLDALLFAAVSAFLIRALGDFRARMEILRTHCKAGELGEATAPIPVDTTREPDDLTLLARSFDAMRSRLAEQSGSDPLTACANRRTLEKRLLADWRFARRRSSCVAVAAIDIDHFKQINDTGGHPIGDLVLQQLASIMMSTARDTDTVARLGGDEFVIVLPDTDWHGATSFAERLRHRVNEFTFGPPGAPLAITISVGVAIGDGASSIAPQVLLGDADRSLYRAKTEGRNRVSA